MRPDPYKRARSRQYQAKHGMLPVRKSKESETLANLPTNISQEQLSQLMTTDNVEEAVEFDNFDEGEPGSVENAIEQDLAKYALPTTVINYLMQGKQSTILTEADAHRELVNQYPDELKELFSRMPENDLIIHSSGIKAKESSKLTSTGKAPTIQLQSTANPSSTSKPAQPAGGRTDKLELEDWLDQVL